MSNTENFTVDKKRMKGATGCQLTQSLFLELGYKLDSAIYSLKDYDHTYKGVLYPSLKRLYIEMEDVVGYDFATTYLLGWSHWNRMKANKVLSPYTSEWEEELEIKLRSQAVRSVIEMTADGSQGSFQAAKWLADGGWNKRAPGRPSKDELDKKARIEEKISDEFSADIYRLSNK